MSKDPNDFINSAQSVPGAKFDTVGDTVKGTVVDVDVRQCTKFGTTEPEFWDNGDPKEQLVITLQTDLSDGGADDDGKRRIYAPKPSNMLQAIGKALKDAGAKVGQGSAKLDVGGTLAVRFTGQRPHEKPGFNPIKEYAAAYAPPANSAADALLGSSGEQAENPAPQPVAVGASASADLLG